MFTMFFNKGIKVKFGLLSVNESWLSPYHMQNSSCLRNTKLTIYKSSRGLFEETLSVVSRSIHFFQQSFNSMVPLGCFKKIQIPRPHLKLLISRNSKLPSEEVISQYDCPLHIHFGHDAVFPFKKKKLLYYFHFYTPRPFYIACIILNLKGRVGNCLLIKTKGEGETAKAAFCATSWKCVHWIEAFQ